MFLFAWFSDSCRFQVDWVSREQALLFLWSGCKSTSKNHLPGEGMTRAAVINQRGWRRYGDSPANSISFYSARTLLLLADRGRAVQHSPDWISVGANREG
jgi:hypothetical protein